MNTFRNLGISEEILANIEQIGYTTPTPIQAQAIPVAIEGHDILGSAQTGTGKTASFALPMLTHLLKNKSSSALVILPTRELASQVQTAIKQMTLNCKELYSTLLIGGDSMLKQKQSLKRNPRIIIGTPGRINDHLTRKTLSFKNTDFLVLDETDRMLDMGFGIQIEAIVKFLPQTRQTLMFSATLPKNIISLSQQYLTNPVRIAIGDTNSPASKIKQELIKTTNKDKYSHLVEQVSSRSGSFIVFVKTKSDADKIAEKLNLEGNISARAIHGDLRQSKRERVISSFRKENFQILVATDIASRGLDIPHIENVVNYDLPQCPEDYIHRIGRTGRAGAKGLAINLLSPSDGAKWRAIHKLINPTAVNNGLKDEAFEDVSGASKKKRAFGKKSASKKERFSKGKKSLFSKPKNASKSKSFKKVSKPKRDKKYAA